LHKEGEDSKPVGRRAGTFLRRTNEMHPIWGAFHLCAGQDSNLRRPKPIGLQPIAIDHSATDAVARLYQIWGFWQKDAFLRATIIRMNRRVILVASITIGLLSISALPILAAAQTAFDPGTIVPQCGYFTSPSNFKECTFCDFMQLVRNVLNLILFLTMVSAGGLFAWAGWLFATSGGNGANHQKAKNIFKSVLIGLVLVLGAFTIVNTLMKMLVSNDFSIGSFTTSWSTICPETSNNPQGNFPG
jgi:hypothetical protein